MDLRTRSTMFAGECIRNACRKFPDFRASSNQFGPNDNSTHLYDHRRNGIPIYHDTSHGICYATPPSPQCPSTTTVDSGLRHHSDRFQWSIRHRFARRERERIQVARLDLRPGFSVWYFFLHGQHCVQQILYRNERFAHACAADRALTEGIARNKPLIIWYGSGRRT
jgi:hypothetical protein